MADPDLGQPTRSAQADLGESAVGLAGHPRLNGITLHEKNILM
jgi:hypothetical protein